MKLYKVELGMKVRGSWKDHGNRLLLQDLARGGGGKPGKVRNRRGEQDILIGQ